MVAAPYLERLRALPRLSGSLAAITAAVVGVILNLSVWFALHVLFGRVDEVAIGPIRTSMPEITTINFWAAGLSTIAAVLLLRHHLNVMLVLAICGTLGLLIG
jgi:chromate transporter